MLETPVTVTNRLGLHARAAAQLVRLASGFQSRIVIRRVDGRGCANAKSILNILTLAASRGTKLVLEVDGPDEKEAHAAIEAIFVNGFGEV
jgi:phosphocarrier protein HPr